jgi:outer membrane immunogenic protein
MGAVVTGIRSLAAAGVLAGAACVTTAAFAADLPAKAPVYRSAAVAPAWNGFYVGLNAGYGWGSGSTDLVALDPAIFAPAQTAGSLPSSLAPHISGFIGGAQIGYNWRLDRAVVGLEADIAYSTIKGDDSYAAGIIFANPPMTTTQTSEVTWLGTLRPRLGWLWTPSILIYASGGLAYGGVKASTTINVDMAGACPAGFGFCSTGSLSATRVGWTAGGGLEALTGSNWSVRVDYLYFDLGHESYPVVSTAPFGVGGTEVMRADAQFNGHIVRAGLNYHF